MSEEVWNGNQGILSVYVSKARDLPNLNKLDKQNVMLRLRIAHMTRASNTLHRAGQNPVFHYLEKFDITPEIKPLMYVEVYCDRRKKSPLPIGRCEIDLLNAIRADPKEGYCTWYELKRSGDEFAGTIFIELTFTPKVPHLNRDDLNKEMDRLDSSMAMRPIPPLPTESEYDYVHGSTMRQVTPQCASTSSENKPEEKSYSNANIFSMSSKSDTAVSGNGSDPIVLPPTFAASMGTTSTLETNDTAISNTSDTKFHFANLRKLKEKINIFKNPDSSINNCQNESNKVDIEALQKAIGVTSLSYDDDDDDDEDAHKAFYSSSHRVSHNYNQPPLPPIPTRDDMSNYSHSHNRPLVGRDRTSRLSFSSSSPNPHSSALNSPKLPPLPTTLNSNFSSRKNSVSPTRRRPPPRLS
ncbi:Inn1p [Saccharomyces paradoxus]|uniref:Inn1p n=1 Tax=Saccharomyces paradoxus TaxID=27291 RepID=A0A8B8UYF3_SACPA|nr:Inn1 [Saccharomyces paradoxus]QHS75765.1 Inn1 [Saccharomyces paradoxus]